jgi:hypothetical protein
MVHKIAILSLFNSMIHNSKRLNTIVVCFTTLHQTQMPVKNALIEKKSFATTLSLVQGTVVCRLRIVPDLDLARQILNSPDKLTIFAQMNPIVFSKEV